jgi:hypothetical protein
MPVWYFRVEGRGRPKPPEGGWMGFFVHALIEAPGLQEARALLEEDLSLEGLRVLEETHSGLFDSFSFDDEKLRAELKGLATEAQVHPGYVMLSPVHSWPIARPL